MDNPVAGGQSIVGVLDAGDTVVSSTTSFTVPPGGRIVFLARVSAPTNAVNGASNTTRIRVGGGYTGILTATDITTVATGSNGNISDEGQNIYKEWFEKQSNLLSGMSAGTASAFAANENKPEGPFGDHLGYYSLQHDFPLMRVHKVYHKQDAIWPFTVVGRPPSDRSSDNSNHPSTRR